MLGLVRMYTVYQIPQILFMNPRDNSLHAKKGYKQNIVILLPPPTTKVQIIVQ